jgi:apolipoprotein N-acyltransferase
MTRENLRAVVHPLEGRTVYARLGDWPGWLGAAVVVLALGTRRARPAVSLPGTARRAAG